MTSKDKVIQAVQPVREGWFQSRMIRSSAKLFSEIIGLSTPFHRISKKLSHPFAGGKGALDGGGFQKISTAQKPGRNASRP